MYRYLSYSLLVESCPQTRQRALYQVVCRAYAMSARYGQPPGRTARTIDMLVLYMIRLRLTISIRRGAGRRPGPVGRPAFPNRKQTVQPPPNQHKIWCILSDFIFGHLRMTRTLVPGRAFIQTEHAGRQLNAGVHNSVVDAGPQPCWQQFA